MANSTPPSTKSTENITLREWRNVSELQSSFKRLANGMIKVFLLVIPKYGKWEVKNTLTINPKKWTDYMVNNDDRGKWISLKANHPDSKKNK